MVFSGRQLEIRNEQKRKYLVSFFDHYFTLWLYNNNIFFNKMISFQRIPLDERQHRRWYSKRVQ